MGLGVDALLGVVMQGQDQELGSAGSGGAVLPGAGELPGRYPAAGNAGGYEGSAGPAPEAASHAATGGSGAMLSTPMWLPANSGAATGPSSGAAPALQQPPSGQVHHRSCPETHRRFLKDSTACHFCSLAIHMKSL